jgi:hypothetical protein
LLVTFAGVAIRKQIVVVVVGMGEVVEQYNEPLRFPFEANRRAHRAAGHLADRVRAVRLAHLDAQHTATAGLAAVAADRFADGLAERCGALDQLDQRLHQQLDDLDHRAAVARRRGARS